MSGNRELSASSGVPARPPWFDDFGQDEKGNLALMVVIQKRRREKRKKAYYMTMRVTGDEGSLYVDDHDSLPAPRPPETEHRYLSENR